MNIGRMVGISMAFVHLHIYSSYSLLQSTLRPEELVKLAQEKGFQALALTDRNVMYGVIPFYKACLKSGIKPIIGLTADVLGDGNHSYPMIFLAKNNQGFQNLIKISSAIQTKSPEGIPLQWLKHYVEGLFAISPGKEGEIEQLLLAGKSEEAKEKIRMFKQLFAPSSFYLSIQNFSYTEDQLLLEQILQCGEELDVPVVATNKTCYGAKEDFDAWKALEAIRLNTLMKDLDHSYLEKEYYFKSRKEIEEIYKNYPDQLENTVRIAEQCNVEIAFHQELLPKYPLEAKTADEYLTELCEKGLHERVANPTPEYEKRLQYELDVIKKMQYSDYFLIVWDFVQYAKSQGITVGPGRGSAAGSLVSYCLGITDVDPIQYNLLFERFLNPERVSMPDIDIDFPDHRRDEVIEYVAEKYGHSHVAQIITFGTFQTKAALRDAGRVLGLDNKELDQVAKAVPGKLGITLAEALHESKELAQLAGQERYRKVFQIARKIEGLPRHTSTHAAGVIISDRPLVEIIPLERGTGEILLTQYPMEILEELGLLKMDFLGLRNLTLIESVLQSIRYREGKEIDLGEIPLDDEKTFQLLQRGDTTGVFQLESAGMRDVLRQLKPTDFEDIVAVLALYRPGPMQNIPVYINRKHGKEPVHYPHPDLEDILVKTYGVIVYQEQIMQIASKMAGFTLGEADLLRRAVSKKNREILDKERAHFVKGALEKGYSEEVANHIYDLIVRFADYGFNRNHAVPYSMIAYQMAYLKAHYPLYFFSALLTSVIGNEEKTSQYIREVKKLGFTVKSPSINKSGYRYEVESDGLRFSLAAIKGVGYQALKEILRARKDRPFTDLFDFCIRVSLKTVNRKIIERLIYSGSMDEFGVDRAVLLASIDVAINHAQLLKPEDDQMNLLFNDGLNLKPKYVEVEPIPLEDKLNNEKLVLGLFLSEHPAGIHRKVFMLNGAVLIEELKAERKIKQIGVFISDERKIRTKTGQAMSFLEISDESGDLSAVVFPDVYRKYLRILKKGAVVLLSGYLEYRKGKEQFVVQEAKDFSELTQPGEGVRLFLRITRYLETKTILEELKSAIRQHPGNTRVVLFYERTNKLIQLSDHYRINLDSDGIYALRNILGPENVRIH